ncbi:hypothetical protein BDW02DRAFT_571087 [Decorospora gaudefroyi]|uniref:Uncharacterized protein n=1 Tax=Decorospora gaudefroyi TaxID=184978 RepID=A0A6A5K545_9PLEO|nr:hypothetical protein BDW02DRAFT_571087 [Decorospora gaudefroyi]
MGTPARIREPRQHAQNTPDCKPASQAKPTKQCTRTLHKIKPPTQLSPQESQQPL